ncbi:MAG TPA: L-threonylcarbamoyladenylate synthase [Polyangiaceae bacterium]
MRVVRVDAEHPDPKSIAEAAAALRAGRLVAFPTETVYGLGALARDREAVKRVFAAKGRPSAHPLIVHVLGEDDAKGCAAAWPPLASELARAFWPGPLTLVVSKNDRVPSEVTGGNAGVALRAPSHPVARAILAALGEPIVAPSANRYQSISPTRAEHVASSLGSEDVLVIDAGACPSGIESTVVDVRSEPRVLRPGALSLKALRALVPSLQYATIDVDEGAPRDSPGQAARHYAPKTTLVLVDRAAALARAGAPGVAVIVFGDAPRGVHALPRDPAGAASALYALLHDLDRSSTLIVVETPPGEPGWEAVADRLRRAAAR